MIEMEFCPLPGFTDGREYVMVRFTVNGQPLNPYLSLTKDDWLGMLQIFKPTKTLSINEVAHQEW